MGGKNDVRDFLVYTGQALPGVSECFLGHVDAAAIGSRSLVKSLCIFSKRCRKNIWRHEAERGRLFVRTYHSIIANAGYEMANWRVLEVGCGPGAIASAFQESGHIVTAIDLWDGRIFNNTGVPFSAANGHSLPFKTASFDAVSLTSVLHHMPASFADLVIKEGLRIISRPGWLLVQEDILHPSAFHNLLMRMVDDLVSGEIGTHQAESHRTKNEWQGYFNRFGLQLVGMQSLFPSWLGVSIEKAFFVLRAC